MNHPYRIDSQSAAIFGTTSRRSNMCLGSDDDRENLIHRLKVNAQMGKASKPRFEKGTAPVQSEGVDHPSATSSDERTAENRVTTKNPTSPCDKPGQTR